MNSHGVRFRVGLYHHGALEKSKKDNDLIYTTDKRVVSRSKVLAKASSRFRGNYTFDVSANVCRID